MKKVIFICFMWLLSIGGYSQIGGKVNLSANDISITQDEEYVTLSCRTCLLQHFGQFQFRFVGLRCHHFHKNRIRLLILPGIK